MKKFYNFLGVAIVLLTLFSFPIGMRGQTTEDVTLSDGTFSTDHITWTCADGNITIQQLKGSSSTAVNSSYISAPRVYKQHILSFIGVNGYTITNIAIKCNGAYYGTTMYAGTEISNNNVDNNTSALNPTWTTANGGTHTIATASTNGLSEIYIQNGHSSDASNQLRITQLTITYMEGSGSIAATTVTINDDDLTNTDVYTSTTAGSLSAIVTETESGDTISGATVAWSSSDTNVATINASGVVTLVGTGTTTITASYAGVSGTYSTSSATYTLGVTSSEPYVQPTTIDIVPNYTFWGKEGQFSGSTYSELSGSQDNLTLDWTRGSGSTYANLTAMRFYKDNTLTFTAPTGYMITSIVITFSTAQSDLSFDPEGYALSGTTGTWEGSASTVTMRRPSNASSYAQITHFTITISLPSDVATPTFSPASGAEFGDEGLSVTITCETSGADIFYTLDGSEPDDESTPYSGAITLSETTTIKAIAYADDMASNVATATYTYVDPNAPGTVNNPYTVAQARDAIDANTGLVNVYATGIISQVDSYSSQYNSITYWISDDGTTTSDQLEVYSGKGLNNSNFSSIDDVEVGATVVVYGTLKKYNSTYEFDKNNYLVSYTAPIHAVETPTFSPVAGTYATAQMVTISCASDGADIFYTLDGSDPDDESEPYSGTITVTEATTIKAIAYADDMESVIATATYHICSQDNPYTVTQALNFAEYQYPANNVYVHGIVSTAPTSLSSGTLTYYISVDGTTTNELEVYKGKDLNNEAFTAVDDIQVGDIVTIYGNVQVYNSTIEFGSGNYLVEFERPTTPAQEYTLTISDLVDVNTYVFAGDESEMLFEGEGSAQILEGTQVMISVDVEQGYVLQSLIVDGTNHAADIDGGMYLFNMPDHNVTVTATAVEDVPFEGATYTLASSIESGKTYIIVGQGNSKYYAMGAQNNNNRAAAEITVDGTTATVSSDDVYEFTINSLDTDGFYSIYDAKTPGYLYAANKSANQLKTEAELDVNGEWEISFDSESGAASVVASNSENRNVMQYNSGSTLFSCYTTASQHPVFLYVKDETPAAETYTLTITGYGNNNQPSHYYLIASPVAVDLSNHALTTGDFDLYSFDQAQENEWQNWKDDTDGHFNLVPGTGYLYAHKTGGDFELAGTAYEGNGTVTLVKNDNAPHFAGWNLVGNPFGEVAYIEDGRDFYVLTDGNEILPYDGNDIQRLQGIFVIAQTNNETMTFTTTAPANTGDKFVFNISQGRGDVIDRAMVRFGEGRTLPKFQLHETSTKLYIPQGDEDYAVVYAANNGELPLNFRAAENGSYTLSFDNQAGEFSSLHLIDNKSRADIDLLSNPSYTFNAETTDDEGRFTLVYSKAPAGQTLPYSYGFEDNNLATDGWIANITSSSSGINNQAAHSGSYGFRFNYSESSGSLISPLLIGGDKGVDVSFWYKEYSSSYGDEQFYVGYTTDESTTDVDRFTFGDIITASTSWQQYTNSFPAGTKRIAIKYVYNDAFYLYLDDFSFEALSSCAKPTNLAVNYEGGLTATVTWEGDARSYNIDVNGTVTNGVYSPYTLSNLEYGTNYTVMVQADCGDEQSGWVSQSFRTDCGVTPLPFFCGFEDESEYGCLALSNTADGTGLTNGTDYVHSGTLAFAFAYNTNPPQYLFFPEFEGTTAINMSFFYKIRSTNYPETFQVGYSTTTQTTSAFTWLDEVTATNASEWLEYVETLPNGTKYVAIRYNSNDMYYLYLDDFNFEVATGCLKPSALEATNISTTSAVLNWTGDNDSYVLQYRTAAHNNMGLWEQVGSDKAATATLTQYTYDLSDYSGTGSIAIRHYNVSDMFRLAIDDVVVTDARGQELVNEDFESGSIPSSWTNYDMDGDGNVWAAISFESQVGNGDYVAVSDSWQQSVGALTPDNWLIIPNVELGGTFTFYARGVDANYPQENFGVFVTTASLETIFDDVPAGEWSAEIATLENSYELTGLTANMPYEWRVKGICDDTESGWASSSFSTIDEGFKTFITAGAWNVADNWFPAGVPTIEDEVSIEAAATVPAGVVATAKRAVLNGGSILVKDGGQLKQGAATLNITMEKEITGYGEGDGNYYFIASPFGGRTQLEYNANWSHVLNVTSGDYDLYAFDPTQELEWINYESQDSGNPHELFYEMSLQSGTGYLYANKVDKTLAFTGTAWSSLNSSTTVDYTYNAESTDDWNGWKLVGNPYTCNGYINYVDERGNVLDADFYTLNLNNKYSLMSSNQPLPPCTGALMNVSATGKVQYSTEPTNSKSGMLNMTVSEGRSTVDQARVRFGEGHNLKHMSFNDHNAKLYIPQDNKDYAVVYAEAMGEMPVNFKAEKNGSYTISFNNDNVEFSYLHLIDNLTGNDVDLLENPNYNFDARYTDYAQRFKLVYTTGTTADNDEFGFISNNHLMILGVDGQATLKVMDVTGRTLSTETFSGNYDKALNLSSGVYMLQLIQGNNVKTQKIVVK